MLGASWSSSNRSRVLSALAPWVKQLANRGLQRTIPCRIATTRHERTAIARLRYDVHVVEQNVSLPEADHVRRTIEYPDDDAEGTLLFYVGSARETLGSLRVRVWTPGRIPTDVQELYSTDLLPGCDRLTVCDVTKMVVRPEGRATAAMAALTGNSIYETVSRHRNALMLACCAPGLLRRFRAIGLRTFGGRLRHSAWGLTIPLVGITHDVDHTYAIGSPWYPALRRLARDGRLPPDLPAYRRIAEGDRSALTERCDVEPELQRFAATGRSRFLKGLTPASVTALSRHAMILDVPSGVCLVRKGVVEREMFLPLAGELQAERDGVALRTFGPGDTIGHAELLGTSAHRRDDVRATSAGRVLVVRRKVLAELDGADPQSARALRAAIHRESITTRNQMGSVEA